MKKYVGTVVLLSVMDKEEAAAMVNLSINENIDRYKAHGVEIQKSDNYVTAVDFRKDAIIVSVELKYDISKNLNIDMDSLILGG